MKISDNILFHYSKNILKIIVIVICIYLLINSSLDIYNDFAYDKAIVKQTPFGITPLLRNPTDYKSADGFIKCGEFVYVEDWLSAYNGRVVFARVKSKLKEGYINKELLVETNINVIPVFSSIVLVILLVYSLWRIKILFHKKINLV